MINFPIMKRLSSNLTFTRSVRLLPIAAAIVLAGCSSMAPEYERSNSSVANEWQFEAIEKTVEDTQGLSSQQALDIPWKDFIKDERLEQVIDLALSSNRSLRETIADVESARATYRIQRSDLFPDVNVSLSGDRTKYSTGEIDTTYEAQAGFSSYELDLFGKNRSLSEAEMDGVFGLPYKRVPHPSYGKAKIPAYDMIKTSINIMRGCFGGCTFCSITELPMRG